MTVFKEYYEVVGAAKAKAKTHAARRDAALSKQWKVARSFGAEGFRPGHNGTIKSLLFAKGIEIPEGLRKIGVDEYQPKRNTKAGTAISKTLAEAPKVESWGDFADTFGWKGRSPMDSVGGRGVIYFCAGVHVVKPRERFFLSYPRELNDKWKPPKGLKLVRESEMLRAIEDHNLAVRRKKRKAKL